VGKGFKDIMQVNYFGSSSYPASFLSNLAGIFQDKLPMLMSWPFEEGRDWVRSYID